MSLAGKLSDAEYALAAFKSTQNISGFATRREILQQEQGVVETQLADASGKVQEARARLDGLRGRLASLPHEIMMGQARQDQIYLATKLEAAKAEVELKAVSELPRNAEARLAAIGRELRTLDGFERELAQLQRDRDMLDESYRAAAKIRDERRLSEHVAADKQSAVRVVNLPAAPAYGKPVGQLILVVGMVASLFVAMMTVLLGYLTGTRFVMPDSIEHELGIAVLAVIPDCRPKELSLSRTSRPECSAR